MEEQTGTRGERPRDKADLLDRISHEWDALQEVVAGLSEDRLSARAEGRWAVKDHLAHLAEWERLMLRSHLMGLPEYEVLGIAASSIETLGEDGINAVLQQRNKDRSAASIIMGLAETHEEMLKHLDAMPFAELMDQHYEDDPEARPVIDWVIGNTYDHYREHRAWIEEMLTDY
jgi:hypothetical protein